MVSLKNCCDLGNNSLRSYNDQPYEERYSKTESELSVRSSYSSVNNVFLEFLREYGMDLERVSRCSATL